MHSYACVCQERRAHPTSIYMVNSMGHGLLILSICRHMCTTTFPAFEDAHNRFNLLSLAPSRTVVEPGGSTLIPCFTPRIVKSASATILKKPKKCHYCVRYIIIRNSDLTMTQGSLPRRSTGEGSAIGSPYSYNKTNNSDSTAAVTRSLSTLASDDRPETLRRSPLPLDSRYCCCCRRCCTPCRPTARYEYYYTNRVPADYTEVKRDALDFRCMEMCSWEYLLRKWVLEGTIPYLVLLLILFF